MTIQARLTNWGRWCRESRSFGACQSIEHLYRSPQCWHPPEAKPPEIDLIDGQAVEWAVRRLVEQQRIVLRLRYAKSYSWQALSRRFKKDDPVTLVMLAEISVKRLLDSEAAPRSIRTHNLEHAPVRVLVAA